MADKPVDEIVNLDAILDALPDSPTSSDVYEATLPFPARDVAASAAQRALNGGGGTPDLAAVLAEGAAAGGSAITGLADPSGDQDAATKKYVDDNGGGGSSAWDEHVIGTTSDDWTQDGIGTWTFVDGVISQTDDTADSMIQTLARYPSTEHVIQADVRFPFGQDAGTVMDAITCAGTNDAIANGNTGSNSLVGEGARLAGDATGDDATITAQTFVDANAGFIDSNATPTAIVQGEWHTLRAVVSPVRQSVYVDGVLIVSGETASGGNTPAAAAPFYPDLCGLGAVGLVDFRNVKVWTRTLPA